MVPCPHALHSLGPHFLAPDQLETITEILTASGVILTLAGGPQTDEECVEACTEVHDRCRSDCDSDECEILCDINFVNCLMDCIEW